MNSLELRRKFLEFFQKNGHKIVPSSSLLPSDPSVLFTTAGMQQFKQYYLGEKSPYGKNVASCQKCIRTSDIDEVGDESHLTFFEMLGNFSFGGTALNGAEGYFKEEAIKLAHKFIVEELGLKIDYVTVFSPDKVTEGDWRKGIVEDKESYDIWKKVGIPEKKIKKEGIDNFWGPTGEEGPCGPTTEIYVDGIEIWNIVFNEFFCDKDKNLKRLEIPGVDTGMGLERTAAVLNGKEDIYQTDLFSAIIKKIEEISGKKIQENKKAFRVTADHIKTLTFLLASEIEPSNLGRGYILRRLMRRAIRYAKQLGIKENFIIKIYPAVAEIYADFYPEIKNKKDFILEQFRTEEEKFGQTLEKGLKELEKLDSLSGKNAFNLYQSYGFPIEMIEELAKEKGIKIDIEEFKREIKKHQELSRTASAGMFKGGLADHKPETIKLHTAHHLLLAALQEVFGKTVRQRGSNINSERLRIDFSFDRKLTDEEKKKIENIVNQKIKEGFSVIKREMPKEEAQKIGAEMEFGVKYGNTVSVYFIEDKRGNIFSKEFCGGPHAANTDELGKFKIIKEEALGSGIRRIKAILE